MATDDDLIRAYDDELGPEPRNSNRGFWVVAGTLLLGGLFLLVEIFANRPLANSIGHAQGTLRRAQAAAEIVRSREASFQEADADALGEDVPELSFRAEDESSVGLDDVSVSASETVWAAAVQARPGACFYIRLGVGADPRYGAGTDCTGEAALFATDPRW
ncbi:MAG TPA: hypothetical protein VMR89_04455 [Actinomycetota bacterium]|nr:hypothetical protein [Actinomycetota bacterium]